jgi:hypothetical protein
MTEQEATERAERLAVSSDRTAFVIVREKNGERVFEFATFRPIGDMWAVHKAIEPPALPQVSIFLPRFR